MWHSHYVYKHTLPHHTPDRDSNHALRDPQTFLGNICNYPLSPEAYTWHEIHHIPWRHLNRGVVEHIEGRGTVLVGVVEARIFFPGKQIDVESWV
jgi:hypothetical protein